LGSNASDLIKEHKQNYYSVEGNENCEQLGYWLCWSQVAIADRAQSNYHKVYRIEETPAFQPAVKGGSKQKVDKGINKDGTGLWIKEKIQK